MATLQAQLQQEQAQRQSLQRQLRQQAEGGRGGHSDSEAAARLADTLRQELQAATEGKQGLQAQLQAAAEEQQGLQAQLQAAVQEQQELQAQLQEVQQRLEGLCVSLQNAPLAPKVVCRDFGVSLLTDVAMELSMEDVLESEILEWLVAVQADCSRPCMQLATARLQCTS